jgi:RHH-type proline utilization regulon transcriptional repressor/proline dehydrogenase/delta 1-pyrroline-5-carboxylate dehydrogenase
MMAEVPTAPRRTQNRALLPDQPPADAPFANEPDTDFALSDNRRYITSWLGRVHDAQYRVRGSVSGTKRLQGFDPSRPGHVPYTIDLADAEAVEEALLTAVRAQHHHSRTAQLRREWLRSSAHALRSARGELTALMVLDAGKRVEEADVEISEAIDFAEYYLRAQHQLEQLESVRAEARGVVVVTPPWNFPLAIALGGVFAALVAGNAVILKPALETPLVAQRACELLWNAGVPQDLLQLVICEDDVGSQLIVDPRTSAVVLTGATQTARLFHGLRPDLLLFAETGGKNALFVSAMSDHEQAIVDAVASAFGHAGQKCSALSQLILERELYEDPAFLRTLSDATSSLKVGSAWELDSFVTPLIAPPSELQREALTTLLPGESWLLQPRFDAHNPRLVSPGIKLGVAPSSPTHLTEYFCPLLGVLCANDVSHAVTIANSTRYGLTAGIHSLDEREQAHFIEHIEAGNVYVNRKITGAIVRRQPFGGWKESSFGPGAKAGGPNYVAQFVELSAVQPATREVDPELVLPAGVDRLLFRASDFIDVEQFQFTAHEYVRTHTQWFASATDETGLRGEDNLFRYRPLRGLFVWADEEMQPLDLALISLGAELTDCPVSIYAAPDSPARGLALALGGEPVESEAELALAMQHTCAERLRCIEPLSGRLLLLARQRGLHVISGAPIAAPRFELLHTLREQSVSVSYHRYGHMGLRGLHSQHPRP